MSGLQKTLENLNEGTICVCFCVSLWLLLIAARMDNILLIPYWAVFIPLWIWKFIVLIGWLVGLIVWFKQCRVLLDSVQFSSIREDPALPFIQAMSASVFFHLIIGCSEVLLCIHLSTPTFNLTYLTILTPLLIVGALGVFGFLFVMIDSRSVFSGGTRRRAHNSRSFTGSDPFSINSRPRHVCSFTLELCIAANLLQLLFLIARLDFWIRSNWIVTFIPSFILLAMGFIFCLAGLTVALITYFTAFFIPVAQRRLPVCYYASHLLIVIFLFASLILLGFRLDGHLMVKKGNFLLICIPVLISLFLYALHTSGPGNPWWFGLNRNVTLAIIESCPTLQLCVNTRLTKRGLWISAQSNRESVLSNESSPDTSFNPVFPLQFLTETATSQIPQSTANSLLNYSFPFDLENNGIGQNPSLNKDCIKFYTRNYSEYLLHPD